MLFEKMLKQLEIFILKRLGMMIDFKYKKSNLIYSLLTQNIELTTKYQAKPIYPIQHALR